MQEAGVTVGEMVQLPTGLVLILQITMIITLQKVIGNSLAPESI